MDFVSRSPPSIRHLNGQESFSLSTIPGPDLAGWPGPRLRPRGRRRRRRQEWSAGAAHQAAVAPSYTTVELDEAGAAVPQHRQHLILCHLHLHHHHHLHRPQLNVNPTPPQPANLSKLDVRNPNCFLFPNPEFELQTSRLSSSLWYKTCNTSFVNCCNLFFLTIYVTKTNNNTRSKLSIIILSII